MIYYLRMLSEALEKMSSVYGLSRIVCVAFHNNPVLSLVELLQITKATFRCSVMLMCKGIACE